MRVLLLDNYDSFTYNLYDYLLQTGVECVVHRNDVFPLSGFENIDFQAIVLSPGPKRPADAGLLLPLIQRYYQAVPILGICLGHQAIGEHFGARLIKARLPMHGKTSVIRHDAHPIFEGIPEHFEVMRYHSLLLDSLENTPLRSIAASAESEIMALEHPELPLLGLQFHPESVLTEYGLQLLKNWVKMTSLRLRY